MECLFLVILFIIFLVLEKIMDNIIWIGIIAIIILLLSIINAAKDYARFGFDFGEFIILIMKLSAIAGIIYLMCV